MKKKTIAMILAVTLGLALVACSTKTNSGTNEDTSQTQGSTSDQQIGTQGMESNTTATNSDNEPNQNFEFLLPRESDDQYFKPATDDYAYIVNNRFEDDFGDYEERVTLYSFDENGRIVQEITRTTNSYYLRDDFNLEDYYGETYAKFYTLVGDTTYCDIILETEEGMDSEYDRDKAYSPFTTGKTQIYREAISGNNVEVFFSNKTDHMSVALTNTSSLEDYAIVKYLDLEGKDYYLKGIDYPSVNSDGAMRDESIQVFDEKGECIEYNSAIVFTDAASAQASFDAYAGKLKAYMEVHDNIILEYGGSDSADNYEAIPAYIITTKWNLYKLEEGLGEDYFSVPYLTESQLNMYMNE